MVLVYILVLLKIGVMRSKVEEFMAENEVAVFGGLTGNMYIVCKHRKLGEDILEAIRKAKSSLRLHTYYPYYVARIKATHTKKLLKEYVKEHNVKHQRALL